MLHHSNQSIFLTGPYISIMCVTKYSIAQLKKLFPNKGQSQQLGSRPHKFILTRTVNSEVCEIAKYLDSESAKEVKQVYNRRKRTSDSAAFAHVKSNKCSLWFRVQKEV
jgi:hypothetical protein